MFFLNGEHFRGWNFSEWKSWIFTCFGWCCKKSKLFEVTFSIQTLTYGPKSTPFHCPHNYYPFICGFLKFYNCMRTEDASLLSNLHMLKKAHLTLGFFFPYFLTSIWTKKAKNPSDFLRTIKFGKLVINISLFSASISVVLYSDWLIAPALVVSSGGFFHLHPSYRLLWNFPTLAAFQAFWCTVKQCKI